MEPGDAEKVEAPASDANMQEEQSAAQPTPSNHEEEGEGEGDDTYVWALCSHGQVCSTATCA